jgi:hypothetical protein
VRTTRCGIPSNRVRADKRGGRVAGVFSPSSRGCCDRRGEAQECLPLTEFVVAGAPACRGLGGGRRLVAGGVCVGVGVEVRRSRSPAAHPRPSSRTQRSKQARLGFFGRAAAGESVSRGGGSREEGLQ